MRIIPIENGCKCMELKILNWQIGMQTMDGQGQNSFALQLETIYRL